MDTENLLLALRGLRVDGVGLRDWSFLAHDSRLLTLGVKDREIANAHAPVTLGESCEVQYRLIWEDGLVSRGSLERGQLQGDPTEALAHARGAAYDDPDSAVVCGPSTIPDVEMHDPQAAAIASGDTEMLARRIKRVRELVAEGGLRTWSGSSSAGETTSRVMTSAGLDVASHATTSSWFLVFDGEAGDGFASRRADSEKEFDARVDRLLLTARRLATPGPEIRGGQRRVILAPAVVESYVMGTLLENLDGSAVAHGEGHFRREQFGDGRPVLREDLSFRLDPLTPLRRGSYRCTWEGVPAERCTFIERGRLLRPVLSLKYARRLGLDPTPLPAALDTVYLEGPPRLGFDEALGASGGGALVLSVLGVHTQDEASGDFSLSAPQALAIGNGNFEGRLRGTIAGNLFDILASDDLQLVDFVGEHTPGLLITCRFDPP